MGVCVGICPGGGLVDLSWWYPLTQHLAECQYVSLRSCTLWKIGPCNTNSTIFKLMHV
jgi:hypothetical protein